MNGDDLSALARHARTAIARKLGVDVRDEEVGAFTSLGASFVTLRWNDGRLQGCIGSLEPRRALAEDVAANALAACFADPRARPISANELDDLKVEVSVLSTLERITYDGTEASARAALRVGTDGVLLTCKGHRGTFLPQMWAELETPEAFLTELKRKARLSPDFWSPEIELQRYTVAKGEA